MTSAIYRLKKAYYSFRRQVLYCILIVFGIPRKLDVRAPTVTTLEQAIHIQRAALQVHPSGP
jgi:hypothetical protein